MVYFEFNMYSNAEDLCAFGSVFYNRTCPPNSSFGGHGHQLLRKGKESERYSRSLFVVLKFPEVEVLCFSLTKRRASRGSLL